MKSQDGAFFISAKDFISGFRYFTITYYHDDWDVSFYEKKSFNTGSTYEYKFTLPRAQEVFAGADVYVERMFPNACRGSVSGTVRLLKGSQRISQTSFTASLGFGYLNENLAAGTYTIQVLVSRYS